MPSMTGDLPILYGDRVVLRQMDAGDVDSLFAVFSDPEVTRYWSSPPLLDRDAARELLSGIDALRLEGTLFQWGITLRDTGQVVGTATLAAINHVHRRAEVGFALGRAHWGRGLAGEAVSVLLEHVFEELDMHRIEADTDPGNAPSIQLLERLGFSREGYLPQRWHVHGHWHDTLLFGLLKLDWLGARMEGDIGETEGRRDT